jgi:hypothetical protein
VPAVAVIGGGAHPLAVRWDGEEDRGECRDEGQTQGRHCL